MCKKRPCETTSARKKLPKKTLWWVSFAVLSPNEVNLPRCKFPWELERRWVSTWHEWNSRDEAWIERKQSHFSVTFSMASPFSYRTSLYLRPDFLVFLFTQADICVKEERENPTRCKWHWCFFPLFFQMQQLGNMKDNFDDLSDPEQFACLVNARQFVFINLKRKILRLRGIVCFLWSTSCTV